MRLYYLEMKRLIRTKSVWILMIAMVVLAAVMAYVPVTFIRAYKTDAGNVQAVTGGENFKRNAERYGGRGDGGENPAGNSCFK